MSKLEKLDLGSGDPDEERREKLVELFPEACEDGKVDLEALRRALGDVVDEGDERYSFTWPGKADAIRQSQIPSRATLRPRPEKSMDWDTTKNLYIEGDNLEVLKLLQRAYHGKVKMIYIDPPYNTGHDFVYKDSFGDSVENYKEQAGLSGQSNAETSGRFHSAWCSMMYPRLRLARELLTDDGVIFISIGEEESSTLKMICLELFGEDNFVGNLIWQSRTSISNDDEISSNHNHTLIFSKNRATLSFGGDPIDASEYSNPDNDPRGPWKPVPIDANHAGGDTQFPILNPYNGKDYYPPNGRSWSYNRKTIADMISDNRIAFGSTGNSAPKRKLFLSERNERGDTKTPSSLLLDAGTTKTGTEEIMKLLGNKVFDYPKPSSLIKRLIKYGAPDGRSLVLDFFSGSASTAQAVIEGNVAESGNNRFILVQLPENLDELLVNASIDAKKTTERAISFLDSINKPHLLTEIGEERVRRAGRRIAAEVEKANPQPSFDEDPMRMLDIGFRVLSLDESCFDESNGTQLFDSVIKEDRTDQDVIMEVMLKWGLEPTLPVERVEAAGYPCWSVAKGELVCCMAEGLSMGALEAIAAMSPRRVLILDRVLDDSLKLNASYIFGKGTPEGDEIELRTV